MSSPKGAASCTARAKAARGTGVGSSDSGAWVNVPSCAAATTRPCCAAHTTASSASSDAVCVRQRQGRHALCRQSQCTACVQAQHAPGRRLRPGCRPRSPLLPDVAGTVCQPSSAACCLQDKAAAAQLPHSTPAAPVSYATTEGGRECSGRHVAWSFGAPPPHPCRPPGLTLSDDRPHVGPGSGSIAVAACFSYKRQCLFYSALLRDQHGAGAGSLVLRAAAANAQLDTPGVERGDQPARLKHLERPLPPGCRCCEGERRRGCEPLRPGRAQLLAAHKMESLRRAGGFAARNAGSAAACTQRRWRHAAFRTVNAAKRCAGAHAALPLGGAALRCCQRGVPYGSNAAPGG